MKQLYVFTLRQLWEWQTIETHTIRSLMVGEMSVTEEEEGGVSEVQAHIGDWGGR